MAPDRNRFLADILVGQMILDSNLARECLATIEKDLARGKQSDLVSVLVSMGYFSQNQLLAIVQEIEQDTRACGECGEWIYSPAHDSQACPHCKAAASSQKKVAANSEDRSIRLPPPPAEKKIQKGTLPYPPESPAGRKDEDIADVPGDPQIEIQIGSLFSHHRVEEKLGEGGMGTVYRAFDTKLRRRVALKVLGTGPHITKEQVQRFLQEASVLARLKHPNIVEIYEIGESPRQYFAMEYVDGGTLAEAIQKGRVSPKQAAAILQKIAEAVFSAHKAGIIHRDINPSNILLDREGQPKIMDFGVAKDMESSVKFTTKAGQTVGTPVYMAPEQAKGRSTDKTCDIYALGATLYHALAGRPPFEGNSYVDVLQQVSQNRPIPPRELNPDAPKDLEAICLKCLEKKPQLRYPSARLLAKDLQNFLENRSVMAQERNFLLDLGRFLDRNRRKVLTASALLLLTLAAAWFQLRMFDAQRRMAGQLEETRKEQIRLLENVAILEREKAELAGELARFRDSAAPAPLPLPPSSPAMPVSSPSSKLGQEASELLKDALDMAQRAESAERVAAAFEKAKSAEPENSEVYRQGSLIYYTLAKHEKNSAEQQKLWQLALDSHKSCIQRNPQDHISWFRAWMIFDFLGIMPSFNEALDRIVQIGVTDEHWYMARGWQAMNQAMSAPAQQQRIQSLQQAIQFYQKGLDIDGESPWLHTLSGFANYHMNNMPQALDHYQKALRSDPGHPNLYYQTALAYNQIKDFRQAETYYVKCLNVQPRHVSAHANLGNVYLATRNLDRALYHFQQSIAINPNYAEGHNCMGVVLLTKQDYRSAIACFKKTVDLAPTHPVAYNNMGNAYQAMEDYANALNCYRLAVDVNQAYPDPEYNIASILAAQGKDEESLSSLERAFQKGYRNFAHLERNAAFESMRPTEEFRELVARYRR